MWQDQVEVLTAALQQANAEKAVLAADKARLEQEVSRLRLQLSMGKPVDLPDSKLRNGHSPPSVLHVRLFSLPEKGYWSASFSFKCPAKEVWLCPDHSLLSVMPSM